MTEINHERLATAIIAQGYNPTEYLAYVYAHGYTITSDDAGAYIWRIEGAPAGCFEGHVMYGGAAAIDSLTQRARDMGLIPYTTISVPSGDAGRHNRLVMAWLQRKRGWIVDKCENSENISNFHLTLPNQAL